MGATDYREILLSWLYPGAQTSVASLQLVIRELERLFPMTWEERQRTLLRTDAGFGSAGNLTWLLPQGYQVLTKGYSGKRAAAYARRVGHWSEVRPGDRWLAWSPIPLDFALPTRTVVARWRTSQGQYRHALYITTLCDLDLTDIADLYDDRGGAKWTSRAAKWGS